MERELQMDAVLKEDFELFKSNVCHIVKAKGDISFINLMKDTDTIIELFLKDKNKEGFYLLAITDYLCRVNSLPQIKKFDSYRNMRLKQMVFPRGILLLSLLSDPCAKENAIKKSIPEFLKYNIVEEDIRNAY